MTTVHFPNCSCGCHTNVGRVEFASRPYIADMPWWERSGRIAAAQELGQLWPLIQELERACWERKWSKVKAARKALEARLGKRPSDPLFADVQGAGSPSAATPDGQTKA